jgi:hypothetical protein
MECIQQDKDSKKRRSLRMGFGENNEFHFYHVEVFILHTNTYKDHSL